MWTARHSEPERIAKPFFWNQIDAPLDPSLDVLASFAEDLLLAPPRLARIGEDLATGTSQGVRVSTRDVPAAVAVAPELPTWEPRLLGGIRRYQVGLRVLAREILYQVLVHVYAEDLVVQREQRVEHGAAQPPQADDYELPTHPIAISSSGSVYRRGLLRWESATTTVIGPTRPANMIAANRSLPKVLSSVTSP